MLTHQDKLILYALTVNCRFPYSTISKIANLKPQTVKSRIEWMEKEGIIDKYYITVFKSSVGIIRYADMFLKGKFTQEQIDKIAQIPEVGRLTSFHGNYQLIATLNSPTNERASEVVSEIRSILKNDLESYDTLETSKSRYLQRLFFLDKEEESIYDLNPNGSFQKKIMLFKPNFPLGVEDLDETDLSILEKLRHNAISPLNELSERVGASRITVEKKIVSLIERGIVGYFTVNLDYSKMGYQKFFVGFNTNDRNKVLEHIKQNRHAHSHYEYKSKWDLAITFFYKDSRDMFAYLRELQEKCTGLINSYDILTATEEHKFESFQDKLSKVYAEVRGLVAVGVVV